MDDTGPGPVPISASKRSIFFWFSSIDLICLLRTRGSWWGESCGKIPSLKWTKTDLSLHKTYRHCHLFDSEAHGVADLGQGVHAALVRPRVPGLRRADHQRPVVRSDSRPESICIVMSIPGSEIVLFFFVEIKKMLNIFLLFVEIKFSRFNLTWRTAAEEVNLQQEALQDQLFMVGPQSSENLLTTPQPYLVK